tara:strand:- start:336 stop:950 length:615 start_codon:yes stop_codon:yes gene_type:complete
MTTTGQGAIVEAEKIDVEEIATIEEAVTEITRIIEVEMEETTVTGSVPSVTTKTSHSEQNAIAVASLKVEAVGTIEEAETETTAEVEMTVGVVMIVEDEMTEILAEAPTLIMIGLVANVKTQTSRLEPNVIAVVPLRDEEEVRVSNGKVTNAEPVTEEIHHNLGLAIGNVHNVENPISQSAMIASDVDVQRELVAPSKEDIIVS